MGVVYGVLIVTHWSYYSDRFYYEYTMSEYGRLHLTFRTWYGVATYIRDLTKAFSFAYSDQYEIGHQNHTPYSTLTYAIGQFTTWETGRDLASDMSWTDLALQTMSLTLQFIAYPMV